MEERDTAPIQVQIYYRQLYTVIIPLSHPDVNLVRPGFSRKIQKDPVAISGHWWYSKEAPCGINSSVEWQLPKLHRRVRLPYPAPIKDGYFDRVTVLIVFAEKTSISGVSLTFKRIIKSYSAIYAPIRIERRIF